MLDGGEEENRKSTEWCNEDLREKKFHARYVF